MNIGQFVDDVVDLSTSLARRFGRRKVLLAGHSWGTVIGALAVARRPDLFSAYVGIGQMSNMAESERLSYEWTIERARAVGDTASVKALQEIGPPPYTGDWRRKFLTERRILGKLGGEVHGSTIGAFGVVLRNLLLSTEYTLLDRCNFFRGILRSLDLLMPELVKQELFSTVPELAVPVTFCLGRHDHEVPAVLSARYFEALRAPKKELVWFEHSAHMPNTEEAEKFNRLLVERIRPEITGGAMMAADVRRNPGPSIARPK
jgi:pimeloyl-ACP methyl ester carboxylesterase